MEAILWKRPIISTVNSGYILTMQQLAETAANSEAPETMFWTELLISFQCLRMLQWWMTSNSHRFLPYSINKVLPYAKVLCHADCTSCTGKSYYVIIWEFVASNDLDQGSSVSHFPFNSPPLYLMVWHQSGLYNLWPNKPNGTDQTCIAECQCLAIHLWC